MRNSILVPSVSAGVDEKIWLPSVFEPVRRSYLIFPKPLEILMPEEPLPEDAQVAYLVGKQPAQAGAWLELFVYRARRMARVCRLESLFTIAADDCRSTPRCTSTASSPTGGATTVRSSTRPTRATACALCSRRSLTARRGPSKGGTSSLHYSPLLRGVLILLRCRGPSGGGTRRATRTTCRSPRRRR